MDMLPVRLVVHHIGARVVGGKAHPAHVIVRNRAPPILADALAGGQSQRVVPHRALNVRAQRPHGSELARQVAGAVAAEVAADHAAALIRQQVIQRAAKAGASADFLHAFHVPAPINAARNFANSAAICTASADDSIAPALFKWCAN